MIDPLSDTWKTLESWVVKEIEAARDKLESGVHPPEGPHSVSGLSARCATLREILGLPKPKPDLPDEADYT